MSIRHCIAGVVLVVVGGLAVNAYQDQPATEPDEAERLQALITKLETRLKNMSTASSFTNDDRARIDELTKYIAAAKEQLIAAQRLNQPELQVRQLEAVRQVRQVRQLEDLQQVVQQLQMEKAALLSRIVKQESKLKDLENQEAQIERANASSPLGRYQFIHRGANDGLLVDTATGHCWELAADQWIDRGNPTTPAANVKNASGRGSRRHTLQPPELGENCIQISESFASDPGWDGMGNRTAPQNFGRSFIQNVGATAGELGGTIVREPAAYYAADVGELDPATDTLYMTGSGLLLDGIGNFRLGWFDKDGDLSAPNLIGIFADTSEIYAQTGNCRGELLKSVGFNKPFTFEVLYNPRDNDGQGSVTYAIDGGRPIVIPLSEAVRRDLGKLDRFGMLSLGTGGEHPLAAFVDNLTYTSRKRQPMQPK